MNKKWGFTLIELLVVIAIIAIIVAFAVTNFLGARERARDVKRKGELRQLKAALRLYYNDYQRYPVAAVVGGQGVILGCGIEGTDPCPGGCTTGEFTAGGTDGCANVYMRKLPDEYSYSRNPNSPLDTDDFIVRVVLDNASDNDIAASQAKCGFPTPTPGQYHVCSD
jgi:prepilin-type N-terminal cleavage/methylation domain-containing protein